MSERLVFWDVDTQVDFMHPDGALYVPGAEEILPALERLSLAAARSSIPVIADADDHEMSDAEISRDPDLLTTFPPHCMRGTPGAERVDATRFDWTLEVGHEPLGEQELRRGLDVVWPRVLIHKKELDVFSNVNTERVLERLAPERIVLYGVALDFCVRCVIDGLLERGWNDLVLVSDATRAIYPERTRELLSAWERRGVHTASSDAVVASLEIPRRFASG